MTINKQTQADRMRRLPEWVKRRILVLEADLAGAQKRLAEAVGAPGASDTVLDPYRTTPINLPNGAVVGFFLPAPHRPAMVRVTIRHESNGVMLDVNCDRQIVIRPRATNSAWIELAHEELAR